MAAEGASVSDQTLRRFCEGSSEDFAWVARYVPFGSKAYTGKSTYPPDGAFLYYSGNEKKPQYAAQAKPAPRGHRPVGKGFTGHVFYAGLRNAALANGVRLFSHAPVRRLVVDRGGAVLGVEIHELPQESIARHANYYKKVNPLRPFSGKKADRAISECRQFEKANGSRRFIRARGGVILSAGGFIYNSKMLSKYRPDIAGATAEIIRLGAMGSDGSGIALGQSVGGKLSLMQNAFVGRSISPPESYLHGVLVNSEGKRFVNEDAYIGVVGSAVAKQSNGGAAWLILDAKTFWKTTWGALTIGFEKFIFYGLPALLNVSFGGTRRARTLAALAAKCGIDGTVLDETVRAYNDRVAKGVADEYGKLPENIAPIGHGPYYALNMSLRNSFCPALSLTLGGLQVDEASGQVMREDGGTVPGLFAAGRTAVGICSAGYMSGLSLADLVFSGRRAATSIIENQRRQKTAASHGQVDHA